MTTHIVYTVSGPNHDRECHTWDEVRSFVYNEILSLEQTPRFEINDCFSISIKFVEAQS